MCRRLAWLLYRGAGAGGRRPVAHRAEALWKNGRCCGVGPKSTGGVRYMDHCWQQFQGFSSVVHEGLGC